MNLADRPLTEWDLEEEPFLPLLLREAAMAKRRFPEFDFWELVSMGWLGLARAREKDDGTGRDFTPYAQRWVRGCIAEECRKMRRVLRGVPRDSFARLVSGDILEPMPSTWERPDRWTERREEAGLLRDAIDSLSPRQKAVVEQVYLRDLDVSEVEAPGKVDPDSIYETMYVARRNLRRSLGPLLRR